MTDPLRSLPGYALRRASSALMAELAERLAPLGLRHVEATILLIVARQPGITQSALGRMLDIQRANMTPIAAGLERRGLLLRVPSDGRSLGLTLSAEGEALLTAIKAQIDAHEASVTARIPPTHRAHLMPILHALWPEGDTE